MVEAADCHTPCMHANVGKNWLAVSTTHLYTAATSATVGGMNSRGSLPRGCGCTGAVDGHFWAISHASRGSWRICSAPCSTSSDHVPTTAPRPTNQHTCALTELVERLLCAAPIVQHCRPAMLCRLGRSVDTCPNYGSTLPALQPRCIQSQASGTCGNISAPAS